MLNPNRDKASLLQQLAAGTLSPAEIKELIEWLGKDELDLATRELLLQHLQQPVNKALVNADTMATLEAKLPAILLEGEERRRRARVVTLRWMRYAAIFIICTGTATYFTFFNKQTKTPAGQQPVAVVKDIEPGKQGAILTLGDGSTIVLDSMGNGVVAQQNGSSIALNNGQLKYEKSEVGSQKSAITHNTLSTPRGRLFQLALPDGTKVWLNAASSITYPTAFTANQRKVNVQGEVYFEVAKDRSKPFIVEVAGKQTVEVLGTHFNINSYTDEDAIKTTLLEGKVKVSATQPETQNAKPEMFLSPGQQASLQHNSISIAENVDLNKVMAWKNGVFNFEDAKLHEVMRQLERWYDIEVIYEKGVPELEFMGKMGRDLTLNEVLRGLQVSKVHCRLEEGRKLIVMP